MPASTRWDIAAEADETSGAAIEDRRCFLALVQALAKLGTPIPLPEPLTPQQRRAA
jgi:hypothetical protein